MKNFIYDKTNTIFHIEQSVCISFSQYLINL